MAIKDRDKTEVLVKLVEHSSKFIKRLPWARGRENDGKIPLEKALLSHSTSRAFTVRTKNLEFVVSEPSEMDSFQKHKYPTYYWLVVLSELLGHGIGRMMVEESAGNFNFDIDSPPADPLTGEPMSSWYRPRQIWTG